MNVTSGRRPYRMRKRAVSAAETGERILRATIELSTERFQDQITLDDIAQRAGVTIQTVLRRFGSKEELVERAAEVATASVVAQRAEAPVGDVASAVDNLLDHYEKWGHVALRLLSQEDRVPQLRPIADRGREVHAAWVERVFAPALGRSNSDRLLLAALVAITDVYVWKVLRIDRGLDRAETAAALTEMIRGVLKDGRES